MLHNLTHFFRSVYVHSTQFGLPFGDPVDLRVTPPDAQQSVGSVVWGHDASADTLFASSEAQRVDDYSGFHVAFDPDQRRRLYDFSVRESGDAMALDSEGTISIQFISCGADDIVSQVPGLLYVLRAQTMASTP